MGRSWVNKRTSINILIQVIKDSNNEKHFDSKDEEFPVVYDFNENNGVAKSIFKDKFKLKIKKQLNDNWSSEE